MSAQRLRRWSNIRTSLFQRVVFAGLEAEPSRFPHFTNLPAKNSLILLLLLSRPYTPRLNFEESQIADPVVMLMMMGNNGQDQDE